MAKDTTGKHGRGVDFPTNIFVQCEYVECQPNVLRAKPSIEACIESHGLDIAVYERVATGRLKVNKVLVRDDG